MRRWPARGTFFRFAYLSGVRRGQLLATRLAQFQPDTGMMTWRPDQTKTDDAHNVTSAGEALSLLLWFWERRDLACPAFFQEDGGALTSDKLNAAWWAACRELGLPIGRKHGGFVIHELRHTMVSDWIHAGVPEKAIMSHTGQKAVGTLHRTVTRRRTRSARHRSGSRCGARGSRQRRQTSSGSSGPGKAKT